MNNNIKTIIILKTIVGVLSIIAFALLLLVLSNKLIYSDILGIKIEVGDEVFVVNESINNQDWIIYGTVIEIKYQDNEIVEYSVLLPKNDVVIYRQQENIFLTYKQALRYLYGQSK